MPAPKGEFAIKENLMPTTMEVAKKLVDLCRQGKFAQAGEELYAPSIVSIETHGTPEMPARMEGIEAIRKKGQWWEENHTVHSCEVKGPWPHGDRFIVTFNMDVTATGGKMKGQRMQFEEAALYTVKDGKITQEEFFYDMGG
jgi:ketosteroid isomerase-like protein